MVRLLAWLGLAAAFALVWITEGHTYDFVYDWLVAKATIDGADPYQTMAALAERVGLKSMLHTYHPRLPGALVLLAPVGLLPFELTYIAGRVLCVASAASLAVVTARISRFRPHWALISLPGILLIWPFSEVLSVSQTDFLVAGLIGLTYLAVSKRDHWAGGVSLGTAVTLKLWPWLLIPALLFTGRWRASIAAGATFVGLNLFGLALGHVEISGVLQALTTTWEVHSARSASLVELVGIHPLLAAALGLALVAAIARQTRWEASFMATVTIALVVAPIIWGTYLVVLVIPLAWLVERIVQDPPVKSTLDEEQPVAASSSGRQPN